MRFLIDECLHESLVELAHAAGSEATHVNYLGLSGQPDWVLAERIASDEFTFVTNNRSDVVELFARMALHPGRIVIVPNVTPAMQRALFGPVLQHVGKRDPVNTVVEVALDGDVVRIVEYELPSDADQ